MIIHTGTEIDTTIKIAFRLPVQSLVSYLNINATPRLNKLMELPGVGIRGNHRQLIGVNVQTRVVITWIWYMTE